MFPYEVDDRIVLKPLIEEDAESLFQLTDRSRLYLREWLPWVDSTVKIEDSLQFIQHVQKLYEENKGLTLGVYYQGNLAGSLSYNLIDWSNKVAYIGYWLADEFQGKGIMTNSVRALIDYAFQDLQLNRVDIRAAYENKKSRAIPERLGFTKEGQIRQAEWLYDHYVDHIVYGMLQSEWTK
ncbi:N-acetyltransferase [Oceanobacillus piezotolerans]|uniref:N-acetyltransferase n=1 Tax=Oceanobacillus piezotolerans TaxID=2448030 RepID=A0A498DEF9_9BACI|nr:GNAT family protein [Oceanobacillus piezotolerans]RLL41769.1 N-acetyltransferase [Oceanobacillus piezotolerans]